MIEDLRNATGWKRTVSRSIVTLVLNLPDPPGGYWMTSGFVVEVQGWWFWLTAEHSFEELDEVLARYSASTANLFPFFDPELAGVPFGYERTHAKRLRQEVERADPIDDERMRWILEHYAELDIGIYLLDEIYVRGLRHAGVEPLGEGDLWLPDEAFLAEWYGKEDLRYYLVGVPANRIETDNRGKPTSAELNILRMGTKDRGGSVAVFKPWWMPEDHKGSLKGMSGSPAFIVSEDRAFWFGIQSSTLGKEGQIPDEIRISQAVYIPHLLRAVCQVQLKNEIKP